MFFAIAPDAQFKPVRQRVHNGHTNAVQTARDLVGITVELTASVQLGHDNFGGRNAFALMDTDRNATTVIGHRYRPVIMDLDVHSVRVSGQSLINSVVDDFVHHMVQSGAIIRVTNIHARALANCL